MKAAVLEGINRIHLKEVPTPVCSADTILVRVDACAVCGTDVKALRHGHRMIKPPVILGHELAATIVSIGSNAHGYYVSERVTVAPAVPCGVCHACRRGYSTVCENILDIGSTWNGGFAEFMLIPPAAVRSASVNKIPDGVSAAAAALTEPLACCLNAQERLKVRAGDSVLIIGCGPIGCLNAMLARTLGASRILMADVSAGRVVIVACGNAKAQETSVELVAPHGRLNFFGGLPKDSGPISFDSNRLHYAELTVVGNHGSTPDQNYRALQLIASGQVNVESVITHRFGLDEVEKAIATAESGEGLKVLVEMRE